MNKILVIADDITGAAEMAGIALRHGLTVQLTTGEQYPADADAEVVVMATDTRGGNEQEARLVMQHIMRQMGDCSPTPLLYKKTDSVLRGHISAELQEIMAATGWTKALLLAQNPSKGRVISDGRYSINGTLLDETPFSFDPEFPARSHLVQRLVSRGKPLAVDAPLTDGINIADATSVEDIRRQLVKADSCTLLAGGADCFDALLHMHFNERVGITRDVKLSAEGHTIIICGSTQSRTLLQEPYIQRIGAVEITMPHEVFHGACIPEAWIETLCQAYRRHGAVIVAIGHEATGGKAYAVRLRRLMAQAAQALVAVASPTTMIVEGGATAYAVLQQLGWQQFVAEHEFAPGVVSIRHGATSVVLKPGSYPWGTLFG